MEALIAMAVAAVLLAIAVPAWSHARAAAGSGAVRADLMATVLEAVRHSAITGSEVVLCPVSTKEQCSHSTNWNQGWMAFADLNGNRVADPYETRVSTHEPLPGQVRLRTTAGRTALLFQPNGGNAGSNVTFTLCDSRGMQSAVTLVLSNGGDLRIGKPTAAAAWNCVYGR